MLLADSAFALTIDLDIKLKSAAANPITLTSQALWILQAVAKGRISEQSRQPLQDRSNRVAAKRLIRPIDRGPRYSWSACPRKSDLGAIRFVKPGGHAGTETQTRSAGLSRIFEVAEPRPSSNAAKRNWFLCPLRV